MGCTHDFVESKTLALIVKDENDVFRTLVGGMKQDTPVEFCIHCGTLRIPARTLAAQNLEQQAVCEHGTAMDVHCCGCHSGYIFERDHVCPEQ